MIHKDSTMALTPYLSTTWVSVPKTPSETKPECNFKNLSRDLQEANARSRPRDLQFNRFRTNTNPRRARPRGDLSQAPQGRACRLLPTENPSKSTISSFHRWAVCRGPEVASRSLAISSSIRHRSSQHLGRANLPGGKGSSVAVDRRL